jgi:phosphoribosylaminoimidazolecarboxamide formyltransferase/IMP cyclohydrolase
MRALVSVSDRTGLRVLVSGLLALGAEVYATDGTRRALAGEGLAVRSVADLTGFPEILGGRVKTLHPAIHAGILARRDEGPHLRELAEHNIKPIDVVVVNLYPFSQTIRRADASEEEAIESIDVGGPALLRAAAKNFAHVTVLVDPADYEPVLDALKDGGIDLDARRRLAAKAFAHTAAYDSHIASFLRPADDLFPEVLTLTMEKVQELRYGENPHQRGAFYREPVLGGGADGLAAAQQLHGIPLSFCNTLDIDAAWACVHEFSAPAVAIVKHTNPCGLACATALVEAYRRAHAGDPMSAYGGAVALNRVVDEATAKEIAETFYEDIIAPGYSDAALAILRKKKNLRVLALPRTEAQINRGFARQPLLDVKRVAGGFLVQTRDEHPLDQEPLRVVSEREPTLDELTDLVFAWKAVKHVRSNAITIARELALVGVGGGQMSRVDAVEIAVRKAGDRAIGAVLASDAFFPKPDGVEAAVKAGITAIIQPGGSIRDDEILRVVNKHHLAMIFTGHRHFRH